VKNLRN